MPNGELHARRNRRYGWIPDLPDARDHLYAAPFFALGELPRSIDLQPQCPTMIYDQGHTNSCTGNAIAGAFQFDRIKQNLAQAGDLVPSRLFIYYNERVIENDVPQD